MLAWNKQKAEHNPPTTHLDRNFPPALQKCGSSNPESLFIAPWRCLRQVQLSVFHRLVPGRVCSPGPAVWLSPVDAVRYWCVWVAVALRRVAPPANCTEIEGLHWLIPRSMYIHMGAALEGTGAQFENAHLWSPSDDASFTGGMSTLGAWQGTGRDGYIWQHRWRYDSDIQWLCFRIKTMLWL